ncbi:hypothetical protein WJX74_003072 [Apatococcus lobatus]|uniref:CAAX prenyl protease 2/Lysostaphin resistance protein A-like domain-containing protein n=1 Tax=Apatococcus lobatus TaxID=904363 RepID=A0AAW1S9Y1_9CHLO
MQTAYRLSRSQTETLYKKSRGTKLHASKKQQRVSRNGKTLGWKVLPKDAPDNTQEGSSDVVSKRGDLQEECPPQLDLVGAGDSDSTSGQSLPEVPSDRIISACLTTSGLIAAVGLLIRGRAASAGPAALHTDPAAVVSLLQFPNFQLWHILVAGGAAAVVTGARQLLLQQWPEFAEASNRSNEQILRRLKPAEVAVVACIPAAAEELFFRGALIPALYPDWRGVVAAGVAFGVLHNSGGRNWSFAAWASAVGMLYGTAFIATQDLLVPIMAHATANVASAVIWQQNNPKQSS